MRTISVVPYNPSWADEFEKIKDELTPALLDFVISIEHVGSTSVPGLYAKPIIDIDIVIGEGSFSKVNALLEKAGYFHIGDLGITGREVFKYENKPHLTEHHLYVCNEDSDELKRHISLRDFLRNNEDYRKKYSEIKLEMASKFPHDIDNYIEGKQPVVLEIYEMCGLDTTYKIPR
jgi:GrpB-like predicted nucleotidyltransferase (UPF0157 family)